VPNIWNLINWQADLHPFKFIWLGFVLRNWMWQQREACIVHINRGRTVLESSCCLKVVWIICLKPDNNSKLLGWGIWCNSGIAIVGNRTRFDSLNMLKWLLVDIPYHQSLAWCSPPCFGWCDHGLFLHQ
jgi:hypothetical protein